MNELKEDRILHPDKKGGGRGRRKECRKARKDLSSWKHYFKFHSHSTGNKIFLPFGRKVTLK